MVTTTITLEMGAMDLTGVIPTTREMVMVVIMIVAMIVPGATAEFVVPFRKATVLEETAVVLNTELLMNHARVVADATHVLVFRMDSVNMAITASTSILW